LKIRSLVLAAAVASAAAAAFTAAPASAWECPKNVTNPYYVTNPVTGGQTRVCMPDLNCEQCLAVVAE
jgi:hypothetical protein